MSRSSSWTALRGADLELAAAPSDSSEDSLDANLEFPVSNGASDPSGDKAEWSLSIPLLTRIHNCSRTSTARPRTLSTGLGLLLLSFTFLAFLFYSWFHAIHLVSNTFSAPRILSTSSSERLLSVCDPPSASGTNNSDTANDSSRAGLKNAEASKGGDSKTAHKTPKRGAHGYPPSSHTPDNSEAGEGSSSGASASAGKTNPKSGSAKPPSVRGSGATRPKTSRVTASSSSDNSEAGEGTSSGASGSVAGTTDPTSVNANPFIGGSGATPSVSRMPVAPPQNAPLSDWLQSDLLMEDIIKEKFRRADAVFALNDWKWNREKWKYPNFNFDGEEAVDLEDDVFE